MSLVFALILTAAAGQQTSAQHRVMVEVFQIIELPITITDTVLVKTEKESYLLKCGLSNNSGFQVVGLRYSLIVVDSMNVPKAVITKNEGLKLAPYKAESVSFTTPIQLQMKEDERLVLMLQHVVSTDYFWEVMKPKEALTAYLAGDYAVVPRVVQLTNQVDAPPRPRVIY